jgi:hypothetical protein
MIGFPVSTCTCSQKSERNGIILKEIHELAVGNDDDNAASSCDGR